MRFPVLGEFVELVGGGEFFQTENFLGAFA